MHDLVQHNRAKASKYLSQAMIGRMVLFVAAAAIFCFPLAKVGKLYLGDDLIFHLQRLAGLSNIWSSPINFNSFMSHGVAVNTYYPWLLYYPAYLLSLLTGNIFTAYKLYIFGLTLLCLYFGYWMAKKLLQSDFRGTIFALVYTFSTYRAADVFKRAAVGEIIAFTVMPLVLLGLWYVLVDDARRWPLLAVSMAALVYAHLLSLILAVVMCLLITVPYLCMSHRWHVCLLPIIKAALMCSMLSLGFIIPMLRQTHFEAVTSPVAVTIAGVAPATLFDGMLNNDWLTYSVGIVCLAALGIILSHMRQFTVFERALLIADGIFLVCTTTLVPMQLLNGTPASQIQFLFRLNMFVTLLSLLLACHYISVPRRSLHLGAVVVLLGCLMVVHYQGYEQMTHHNPQRHAPIPDRMYTYSEIRNELFKNRYVREYRPTSAGAGYAMPQYYQVQFNDQPADAQVTHTSTVYTLSLNAPTDRAGWLQTSVFSYLDAETTIDGSAANKVKSTKGMVTVYVPKGVRQINVRYRYAPIIRLAWAISLAALVACSWRLIRLKRLDFRRDSALH